MAQHYMELMTTPEVVRAQEHYYGRSMSPGVGSAPDVLGQEELDFIAARDSFYLASVTETGWPLSSIAVGHRDFCNLFHRKPWHLPTIGEIVKCSARGIWPPTVGSPCF